MFKYLPERAYERLVDSIDNGTPLDRETANAVASGMKKWAMEKGATHYTHWFHPLTEGTAGGTTFRRAMARRRARGIRGQTTDPARAGRLQFPERRYPQYVRGPWLLGLGSFLPCFYRRRHPVHPDDLHRLHRRVPRLQSPLAESLGSRKQGGGRCLPLLQPGREESIRLPRLGTGILPSRRGPIRRTSRSVDDRPNLDGT